MITLNKKTRQYMTCKPGYTILICVKYGANDVLHFTTKEEVYEYLKTNNFDVEDSIDKVKFDKQTTVIYYNHNSMPISAAVLTSSIYDLKPEFKPLTYDKFTRILDILGVEYDIPLYGLAYRAFGDTYYTVNFYNALKPILRSVNSRYAFPSYPAYGRFETKLVELGFMDETINDYIRIKDGEDVEEDFSMMRTILSNTNNRYIRFHHKYINKYIYKRFTKKALNEYNILCCHDLFFIVQDSLFTHNYIISTEAIVLVLAKIIKVYCKYKRRQEKG